MRGVITDMAATDPVVNGRGVLLSCASPKSDMRDCSEDQFFASTFSAHAAELYRRLRLPISRRPLYRSHYRNPSLRRDSPIETADGR